MRALLAMVAALLVASPAAATVRTLFVGVDHYRYSKTRLPTAEFDDLKGAVSDVRRIKAALSAAYGLDLDPGPSGSCKSRNAISITLTDDCADRRSILAAFDGQVAASKSGDTVIFYFAGHGSRFIDNTEFRQASGYNDTILPTDARNPAAIEAGDILDRELRDRIDAATAKGINVWTIFDSCNSGTATRDFADEGTARSAPYLRVSAVVSTPNALTARSSGSGYRIHFAASLDTEESREVQGAGVYTTALSATLPVLARATFEDIATETALKVASAGHVSQHPQAEGALDATLAGGLAPHALVVRAKPEEEGVTLLAGSLSGMSVGSRVAIFSKRIDALDEKAVPLAAGSIARVDAATAWVVLDKPPEVPLPSTLSARETQHAFGSQQISVGIKPMSAADQASIGAALSCLAFAKLGDPPQYFVGPGSENDGRVFLTAADGSNPVPLGTVGDPTFGAAVHDALQKVARAEALLSLRTDPTSADARLCIATGTFDVATCPLPDSKRGHVLALGRPAQLTVKIVGEADRWVYVLGIDPTYAVQLVFPQNGGNDSALRAHSRPVASRLAPRTPGFYRFVTIATDAPIDARALEQSRAGARDPEGCRTALERLLCEAAMGTRDPATPRVGNWSATVQPVLVDPGISNP